MRRCHDKTYLIIRPAIDAEPGKVLAHIEVELLDDRFAPLTYGITLVATGG